ncbi:hypothetical protein G7047_14355 [Diaphorobacter sp. HDW4A]|uniref:hypothetical protein n=1 Tax=Diaphorobacter sp. HDW4A TaxID=2714924 RepID=UPI0014080A41|nr:hypothetical protein [Diaphorobacter sp. HDW4A]QIL80947.1 hypothetical protein G7047_14355 [Diaphorobacter sp. HDW4A]
MTIKNSWGHSMHSNAREAAVGSICGDSGTHGLSGQLSIPLEYLDNKNHTIHAYFINQDEASSIELQNTTWTSFEAPPPPTQSSCTVINAEGWIMTSGSVGCGVGQAELQYKYVTNMPTCSMVTSCDTRSFPAGWVQTSASGGTSNSCSYISFGGPVWSTIYTYQRNY